MARERKFLGQFLFRREGDPECIFIQTGLVLIVRIKMRIFRGKMVQKCSAGGKLEILRTILWVFSAGQFSFPPRSQLLTGKANYDKLFKVIFKTDLPGFFFFRRWHVMRVGVTMACTECKRRNYTTTKNKKNDSGRIELKKYCRFCHTHTVHKETR